MKIIKQKCFTLFSFVLIGFSKWRKQQKKARGVRAFSVFCQSVNLSRWIVLFHRHLLVIAKVDALRQTGDVCTYVLAVEGVDLVGI